PARGAAAVAAAAAAGGVAARSGGKDEAQHFGSRVTCERGKLRPGTGQASALHLRSARADLEAAVVQSAAQRSRRSPHSVPARSRRWAGRGGGARALCALQLKVVEDEEGEEAQVEVPALAVGRHQLTSYQFKQRRSVLARL
ncbi:unnamed protein product, partial [Prorocentrum cordatum]